MADLILPSASAQTETVVAFVETEPGQRSVRGALSISMFLPGVIKSAVGRLRDGGLGGPILAQHSFTDRGDSKGGNQETWQFEGQFPVTGDALVLTIQSGNSNSPDIFGGGVLVLAVKARDDVTLAALTDIANVRRYYLLQSSTLNPPAAPTANPAPSPWVTAEPTYTEGSTTSLYTVDLTVFTDGTFDYSTVSKSSSYEAAKSAYNKAVAAGTLAGSKAKTFTSTPTVPYTLGDLWRNGNKVYICTTARTSGSYTASDWTLTADKTSENTAADTSKVGGTASATVIQNIATALANGKPFIQQATPSATAVGQLWFPTDSSGRVIGMKVSTATGTGSWQDYLMMAGQILVPGSVGTTEIGPEGVTAANIKASNELWAKLAEFVSVTTQMLKAGNVEITEELLANVITGIIIRGGLFEAGGGSLPMIRVGPASGTPDTGDTYGVYLTTPNANAKGWAFLSVDPSEVGLEIQSAPNGAGKRSRVEVSTAVGEAQRAGIDMQDAGDDVSTALTGYGIQRSDGADVPWGNLIETVLGLRGARLTYDATQALPNGTWYQRGWSSATSEFWGGVTKVNNGISVVIPGYYRVSARVRFAGAAGAGQCGVGISLDGTQYGYSAVDGAVPNQDKTIEVSDTVQANAGQVIGLLCFQNTGGSSIRNSTLTAELIRSL